MVLHYLLNRLKRLKRSKLQVNLEILKALVEKGKLNSTHITYNTYLNNKSVAECLDFLVKNNLVQEYGNQTRTKYEITNLGVKALEVASKIDEALPIFTNLN
jgi:predicted transcriptional regulator